MNKLKKLQKESQKQEKSKKIKDGLKQSILPFQKIKKKEKVDSDKEEESELNQEEKEPLVDSSSSKKGSKKQKSKKEKKKRGRPKSVDAGSKSKSKSSSKSKSKSKKTKTKTKIKKGVDYLKGKYNIRIQELEEDLNLEGPQDSVDNTCCTVCSNRNCIRAAETKNYKLMKNCIQDRDHISTIINPYSIAIGNAIEVAIENNDKKMIEIILFVMEKKLKN